MSDDAPPVRYRALRRPPPRRLQVLRLYAEGYTCPQVAEMLGVSPRTVNSHVELLCRETGAFTLAHLVTIGFRQGWLDLGRREETGDVRPVTTGRQLFTVGRPRDKITSSSGTRNARDSFEHGDSGYVNHACRCPTCRREHTEKMVTWRSKMRESRDERGVSQATACRHGTPGGYTNYGCRCEDCRRSWLDRRKQRAREKKEERTEA